MLVIEIGPFPRGSSYTLWQVYIWKITHGPMTVDDVHIMVTWHFSWQTLRLPEASFLLGGSPVSKWVVSLILSGLTLLCESVTMAITYLLSGINHQTKYSSS